MVLFSLWQDEALTPLIPYFALSGEARMSCMLAIRYTWAKEDNVAAGWRRKGQWKGETRDKGSH